MTTPISFLQLSLFSSSSFYHSASAMASLISFLQHSLFRAGAFQFRIWQKFMVSFQVAISHITLSFPTASSSPNIKPLPFWEYGNHKSLPCGPNYCKIYDAKRSVFNLTTTDCPTFYQLIYRVNVAHSAERPQERQRSGKKYKRKFEIK